MPPTRPAMVDPTPRSRRWASSTGAAAALPLALAGASAVQAQIQTPDRSAAEALFKEAFHLVRAGSWAAGRPTFEQRDVSTARALGDVSTVSFTAGGALAAAGSTLLVMSTYGTKGGTGNSPAPALQASFGPGQITRHGSF